MEPNSIYQIIGYAASALIALSMMLNSMVRLRVLNLIGAAAFVVYGLAIEAYPVAILNGLIVLVNAWFLFRLLRVRAFLQILPVMPDSRFARYFLDFWAQDIERILPGFQYVPREGNVVLLILRDCSPTGIFIAEESAPGVLRVLLDYAVPSYRDIRTGRFLFVDNAALFRERGMREIAVVPRGGDFRRYLTKLGFAPDADGSGTFRLRYPE